MLSRALSALLRRRFSGAVATTSGSSSAPTITIKPASTASGGASGARAIKHQAGSWRERIGYFSTGVAVATVLGYLRLQDEVWASTERIDGAVKEITAGLSASGSSSKLAELEQRLASLEKAVGSA